MFESTAEQSPWIRVDKTAQTLFDKVGFTAYEAAVQAPSSQMPLEAVGESEQLRFKREFPSSQWLSIVQQRIYASVLPPGYELEDDGRWLSPPVAAAAVDFISRIAFAFAVEPYLYSSPTGELVAEFEETEGRMTFIISPDSVTAFSVVDGKPITKKRPPRYWSPNQIRFLRNKILASPQGKKNGPVEP